MTLCFTYADDDDDLQTGSWAHFPVDRESRCNLSIQIESSKATTCRLHPSLLVAQIRTNKSPLLVSYLFSIGDPRHPSPLCPLCLMHDHTSSHLFECKSLPTSLSSLDLWTNPDKVEPFLATWGGDCWLPHDSGAGLCWQHVGGVGSTTTTTTSSDRCRGRLCYVFISFDVGAIDVGGLR